MHPVITEDGFRLHVTHWPAAGPARGTVQIVHGLGEHIGRYEHVAAALNAAGWHVAGHDHRGHGRSEGPRGTIPHALALLDDLARVVDHLRGHLGEGEERHVLLGHSLGGLVAARFVAEALETQPLPFVRPLDGLVLSSPALAVPMGPFDRALLSLLGPLAPDLRVANGLRPAWVSRDPAVVQAYEGDPLVHDRITPRLARFIVDAGAFVRARAAAWRMRTLLMWAGADRCVLPQGSAAFRAAAPASVLTAREWPGLAHEIFNEPEQRAVLAALTTWLAQPPAPPSAPS